jgi:RHS repeat-associated protein
MAVYNSTGTDAVSSSYSLTLGEQHMYGSSRLGIINRNTDVKAAFTMPEIVNFIRGNKFFELSNHLGNVLVTVSDKKTGVSSNGTTIDYFTADVVNANDYYPFGMSMPGRKYSAGYGYRYGFNGKENDNEVKGEGNQQDYGMRISDPRLGRFLSVDPIAALYPMLTPYQFASNRPIDGIDLDGKEFFKKDNYNYRMDYYPVVKAGTIMQGVNNAANNVGAFLWNGTLGALLEGSKGVNNYFAGGYKEPSTNIMASFDQFQNQAYKYHTTTPIKQQLADFGDAATDLRNYEMLPSLIIAHTFSSPAALSTSPAKLPLQGEIFTNSIATRGAAETYAEMTSYKSYWNANDFIKANNPAFDLISTIEKKVVDVATTNKANLKVSSWETNKLKRVSEIRPQGYSSTLQLYVKEGKYTAEQLASYKKSLTDYITNQGLKNVSAEVSEIPKKR